MQWESDACEPVMQADGQSVQAVLMADCGAPSKYRYVPFFGLAAWLVVDGGSLSKGLRSGFWDSPDE